MKDTPQIIEARIRAGYRPPQERPIICRNCGAAGFNPTPYRHRYFCKRNQFYVHRRSRTRPHRRPPRGRRHTTSRSCSDALRDMGH